MEQKLERKNKKLFSLRSRVILTLSLLVIVVSSTLVYLSSDMIYQDKRAYLYEDSFQSVQTSLKQLESVLMAKVRTVQAALPANQGIGSIDVAFWAQDEHLYEIRVYDYSNPDLIEDRKIYFSKEFKNSMPNRATPRTINYKTIEGHFPEARKAGISKAIVREAKAPARFMVLIHLPTSNAFVMFDFIIEKALENIFLTIPYDVTIINRQGHMFYNNHPYNVTTTQEAFYRNFVASVSSEDGGRSGVRELKIDQKDHILAFTNSELFKELYALGAIKTAEAYEVTRVFIIKTVLYAFGLIGLFNIVALLLARSITNPLDELNQTIKNISDGKYNARVEPQKIRELELVGSSFNVMVDKIQEYNARLEEYNRSLEQKVEERTRELSEASNFIHAMVDSLSQGLLVFNRDGICHSKYTRACQDLFGRSPDGEDVSALINYEDRETFKTWINTLFEEPMPFQDLLPFGPQFVPASVPWTEETFKHIALEFFPMRNEEKVENVVMVATDKTQEFKASKENEVQQSYINMLSKVLKDKDTFLRFVKQFNEVLQASRPPAQVERLTLMRNVHSFKGMAGFLQLTTLVSYLHEFENDLQMEDFDMGTSDPRIEKALSILNDSVEQIKGFSPDIISPSRKLEVDEERLAEFYGMLVPMDKDYAQHFKFHFMDWAVENYVVQYKTLIQDLASKLYKKVNPLVIVNGSLKVDRKAYQPFFDSCIHLFRNSLDHGIESVEKRQSLGKPEAGTITLTFDVKTESGKKYLFMEMKDDGGGINVQAIRNKMKKLEYPTDDIEAEDQVILSHIFDPEFSTAETTTELSGRGIGLFDVKNLVEQFEGNIILQTQVDHGTTFSFYLKLV